MYNKILLYRHLWSKHNVAGYGVVFKAVGCWVSIGGATGQFYVE